VDLLLLRLYHKDQAGRSPEPCPSVTFCGHGRWISSSGIAIGSSLKATVALGMRRESTMRPARDREKLGYNKDNPVYVDIKESWWTIGSMITALLALAASV